jgi:poly-gamma-glutamate synthesis protein (capsule biosynthesis protein)
VGDILLTDADSSAEGPPRAIGPTLQAHLEACDVLVGNLECTLMGTGEMVPTEPRVLAGPESVEAVLAWGFDVVTLANNHAFDCLADGFRATRDLLDRCGVAWFGAGDDLAEAARPALLDVGSTRLAFVAAVDERSGPDRFATEDHWGVPPLDLSRLAETVGRLRDEGRHVIVSVHWGEERFLVPSPSQIQGARALADAGASLVLGHHPHVVQGLEVHAGVPILYSLGNFVADEVPFTSGDRVTWNRTGRTGCLLTVDVGPDGVANVTQTPTFDSGRTIEVDESGFGARRFARANRALARGVTLGRYRREYFLVKTVKPALGYLRWSRLKGLRLRQVGNALKGLFRIGEAE